MIGELSAFQAAAGSLKAAAELAQVLIGLKVSAEVREKAIELQGQISSALTSAISAQTSQMELLERVRDLESQLKGFEDWEAEKERYALAQTSMAGVVRMLKKSAMQPGEPPHALCPHCYEKRIKGYLQPILGQTRNSGFQCTACTTVYKMWELPDLVET
jgi:hypothetical protein